jgi:hypothetical protein
MNGEAPSLDAGAIFVETDAAGMAARTRRRSRVRFEEQRDKSARAVIVGSLFLVLFGAALLIGGQAAIDPLLRSAVAAPEDSERGDVVYAMPDGVYCRHLSFDNATAEVVEGGIERCGGDFTQESSRASNGFAWNTR